MRQSIGFLPTNSATAHSIGAEDELSPTLAKGGGESGNKPTVALAYDGWNQTATPETVQTLRTCAGTDGDDRTPKICTSPTPPPTTNQPILLAA